MKKERIITILFIALLTMRFTIPFAYSQNNKFDQFNLPDYEKEAENFSYLLSIDNDPGKRKEYYYSRASAYYNMKKYSEALDDINKAIEIDPRDGRYYSLRGYCYNSMDMYQAAIISLTRAMEFGYVSYDNFYNRAQSYFRLGNYQKALADVEQALKMNPDDHQSLYLRGSVYYMQSEPNKAINDLNRAIEIAPSDRLDRLYILRGASYIQRSRFQQALADINKAMEYNPAEASYLELRAEMYEFMERISLRRSVRDEYLRRARRDYAAAEDLRKVNME